MFDHFGYTFAAALNICIEFYTFYCCSFLVMQVACRNFMLTSSAMIVDLYGQSFALSGLEYKLPSLRGVSPLAISFLPFRAV
jgi:hypothetical protein